MIEQLINELHPCVGQKLLMVHTKEGGIHLVFEDDVIIINFPGVSCRCRGCVEKKEKMKK